MNNFLRDVKFGLRLIFKERVVTAVVVVTLALGIGAVSPIVSLVGSVLLRPFPHLTDPASIYWVFETKGTAIDEDHDRVTAESFSRWKEQCTQFASLAALSAAGENVISDALPERVSRAAVTANYFRTLGLRPELGRDFEAAEDTAGHDHVVILGHAYWQRHFAKSPAAIGQRLSVGGIARTIVGVMPLESGFPSTAEIWIPLVIDSEMRGARSDATLIALGRLSAGATEESANAELTTLGMRMATEFPETHRGTSARAARIGDLFAGPFRAVDIVILICAALTLIVASANVGNVLLAQGTRRRAEIALRTALGSTRWSIVRQLLTETCLLCAMGGALGFLLSVWSLDLFRATMPPGVARQVAVLADLSVDVRWIAVSVGITIGTTLVAGLWPALRLSETKVAPTLKEQGQHATPAGTQRRLSKILVGVQVALALAMLTGAVSAAREFHRGERAHLGFEPKGVLTGLVARPDETESVAFYRDLATRLRAIPGVTSAGFISSLPLQGSDDITTFPADRAAPVPGDALSFRMVVAEGDYFEAAGTRIVEGRAFRAQDSAESPRVAMLSRAAAVRLFLSEPAVGKRLMLDAKTPCTVVGVTDEITPRGEEERGTIYLPLAQRPRGQMTALLRTSGPPMMLEMPFRDAAAAVDRNQPVSDIRPLEAVVEETLWLQKTLARLLSIMGTVATVLALVGIYGMAAYTVGQRRSELGIRAALGASPRALVLMVLREALWVGGVGTTMGLGLSFLIVMALSQATGRAGLPPAWNVALATALFGVVLAASYGPARRAGRVPPTLAMKAS
jgi:putative ABC transport system permease protein